MRPTREQLQRDADALHACTGSVRVTVNDAPLTATSPALDAFTRAYLECALWTSDPNPTSGEWCEHDDWTIANIHPDSLARALADCAAFQLAHAADLSELNVLYHADASQHGHDFLLTRCGHGAGFWDRGYGDIGRRLTDAAHAWGSVDVLGPETNDQGVATNAMLDAWDRVIHIE